MNILLIGGGGREHALAWKLAQSPKVEKIYAAPGNPGMALLPKCECIALDVENLEGVADYAEEKSIDLTVVGPEAPLVAGLADVCKRRGLPVFGPSKAAAQNTIFLPLSSKFARILKPLRLTLKKRARLS